MATDQTARYVSTIMTKLAAFGDRRPALTDDRITIDYPTTLRSIHRYARALRRCGLDRRGGLVIVCPNRVDAVLLRLATHLLGARYTAVEPAHSARTILFVAEHSRATVLVVDAARLAADAETFERGHGPRLVGLGSNSVAPDLLALADAESDDPVPVLAREDDIARVVFTGGSTGRPKAVARTFRELIRGADAAAIGWPASWPDRPATARALMTGPFGRAQGGLALALLLDGVAVHLMDGMVPPAFVAAVADGPPCAALVQPAHLIQLLDHPCLADADCSGLRSIRFGGSPLPPARVAQAIRRFGPILVQTYGQTEAGGITRLTPADHARAITDRPELLRSVGRPLPGVSVSVRDAAGNELPPHRIGEIHVRSATTITGYWPSDPRTEKPRDAWLPTQDLGYLDEDGYLYLVGRTRDMIIVEGVNCYAAPIENALTGHPAVSEAAVVGLPDDRTGEAAHAVIVTVPGVPVSLPELRALVRQQLDHRHEPVSLRVVDRLPRTAVGKPDKEALRRLCRTADAPPSSTAT